MMKMNTNDEIEGMGEKEEKEKVTYKTAEVSRSRNRTSNHTFRVVFSAPHQRDCFKLEYLQV
jgi:hypothetical protein